jgi:polysaccharide export outer membrane protein
MRIGSQLFAGILCLGMLFPSHAAAPTSSPVPTATPTPEQVKKFQQLTPAQRESVQRALQSGSLPAAPTTPTTATAPAPVSSEQTPPPPPDANVPGGLRAFGYDYFSARPDVAALAADLPVPDDYVVGPGDVLLVQLYGKDNAQYELPVTREGVVPFPGIGPIRVGNQPFGKVRDLIMRRVQGQFIGLKASVQVGRLRNIQIFVLGDVQRPGSYTVSGLATLTNAIFASGGIKPIGSLRQIQLKRQGKAIVTLDLYDLLLKGDNSSDARLQPGDVIFVPPIGKTAGIAGEVKRPAIYELKTETKLEELIELAGGLTAEAFPQSMQVERIEDNRDRTVIDIDMSKPEGRQTLLVSGDVVRVYPVSDQVERVVTLAGYTKRAGTYQWTDGMRITQLLPSLGDLPTEVDAHYQLIRREDPKTRFIELLSADLGAALAAPESDANVKLQPRDTVHVFSIHDNRRSTIDPLLEQIKAQSRPDRQDRELGIDGAVHHPGRYPFAPGMRLSDLLKAGGGLTDKAYTLEAELTRYSSVTGKERTQETTVVSLAGALAQDNASDPELKSYDHVVIRRIPNWTGDGFVTVRGQVAFPGRYPIAQGEKLSSVIQRAGGLTPSGFARGTIFLRESVRQREQVFLDRVAHELEEQVLLLSAQGEEVGKEKKDAVAEAKAILGQIRATKALGRVAIKLDELLEGDTGEDIVLLDGDSINIPQKPGEVTVTGQVYFPTSHLYKRGAGRDDYIAKSGGVTERGNASNVYVVHADGSVSAGGGWFSISPHMGAGDTVVVPVKVDRISSLKLATDVTQILYQLAVAVTAIKVLSTL